MGDTIALLASVLAAWMLVGILVARRPKSNMRHPVEPHTRWRIVVPRDARFSVAQAEAWFQALHSRRSDASIIVEIVGRRQALELFLAAPSSLEAHVRAQFAAWFPEARLETAPEDVSSPPMLLQPLELKKPELFLLRLAQDGEADPLLGVIGTLTHSPDESGIQLTLGGEPGDWKRWSARALAAFKTGIFVAPRHWPGWLGFLCELASHAATQRANEPGPSLPVWAAATAKSRGPVLETQLVVWARGDTEAATTQVERIVAQLTGGFRDPSANALVTSGSPHRSDSTALACAPQARGLALSSAELASLFHLPQSAHPLVPTDPGRRVPPVRDLVHSPAPMGMTTWLGEALTPEGPVPFGLEAEERRLHLYVVGKTGTGKSTFLANLARQDLERGSGLALIDPHGDLA